MNPLIANYEKRNNKRTITYSLQPVGNANLKWKDFPSVERHTYYERLSKLQGRSIGTPRVANWSLFHLYSFEDTMRDMMKLEYINEDRDSFFDYSWERALSINEDVYLEWIIEFFSMMYFEKDVDRTQFMTEKYVWFRLCGREDVYTLPEFAVMLGLYTPDELEHQLFGIHFGNLEIDDKSFNHDKYWSKIGQPTLTNPRTLLIKEPLILMESICLGADHLYKHATGLKESSLIFVGHYVTKIARSLGNLVDEKIMKCTKPIKCETWTAKMLAREFDEDNDCLLRAKRVTTQPREEIREQRREPSGLNSSWGDWNASVSEIEPDHGNFIYPAYEPPNVPPYPYPYVPYPHPYTHDPNLDNQGNQGGSYGMGGDDYFASVMPDFEGTSIIPNSGYEVGGSSGGVRFYDDDDMED
ncbi:hypothetical protein Tco_1524807 [Tanacetum coccineum]